MTEVIRPWRGISASERIAARRDQLLDAGLDVIGEVGVTGLTADRVAERAKLSRRYFYESFKDRDEIIVALVNTSLATLLGQVGEAFDRAGPTLLERIGAAIRSTLDFLAEDPRRARLWVETIGHELTQASETQARAAYSAIIADRISAGAQTALARGRIQLATVVHVSGMAYAITDWLNGGMELTREQFVEELATLFVASIEAVAQLNTP
jgi:AcrR family transcriptional regulator